MDLWDVDTFDELQDLMLDFLNGDLETTPWHLGPVDDETNLIIYKLKTINDLGFVTTDSQPGICQEITSPEGKKWNERQRGYITGFMEKGKFKKFVKKIMNCDVMIIENGNPPKIHSREPLTKTSEMFEGIFTDLIRYDKNGKISKVRLTGYQNGSEEEDYTNYPLDYNGVEDLMIIEKRYPLLHNLLSKEVAFTIIRIPRCKIDLVDIVIGTLKNYKDE